MLCSHLIGYNLFHKFFVLLIFFVCLFLRVPYLKENLIRFSHCSYDVVCAYVIWHYLDWGIKLKGNLLLLWRLFVLVTPYMLVVEFLCLWCTKVIFHQYNCDDKSRVQRHGNGPGCDKSCPYWSHVVRFVLLPFRKNVLANKEPHKSKLKL